MIESDPSRIGAHPLSDGAWRFRVWAPLHDRVTLHLLAPQERLVPMQRDEFGHHEARVDNVRAGARYVYRFPDGAECPDPASRFQPQGVHGPSEVVDPSFDWRDADWRGRVLEELIIYELHVGTFTDEGTFGAIIPHLDELRDLGVTALELMPVAQFPGARNWGYDGVYPFAVQESYGGPDGLKRLVNECHGRGLAVILDVVYNHVGPEGNYLGQFGPYFTDRYRNAWGQSINFDGRDSDGVRGYFLANARMWIRDFHLDGLRVDATHTMIDTTANHILKQLADAVHTEGEERGLRAILIAESVTNSPRETDPAEQGGHGLDTQWNDDFHHALHALLTGERQRAYSDHGSLGNVARALEEGFVLTGQYSHYRERSHGAPSRHMEGPRFVVFSQTHDDIGNRAGAERNTALLDLEGLKIAAATYILSPFIPMLFMGEEYGELAPFHYFTSHGDMNLIEAVREGRAREFGHGGLSADPQSEETFAASRLNHRLRNEGPHRQILAFYRELLRLRRESPPLASLDRRGMQVSVDEERKLLVIRRVAGGKEAILRLNFSADALLVEVEENMVLALDSSDAIWGGPGTQAGMLRSRACQVWLSV